MEPEFGTTYYSELLWEEQERLDAVNDALDALDPDRFYRAVRRVNDEYLTGCAGRIADSRDLLDVIDALEEMHGALIERIECLRPLAEREEREQREWEEREYRISVS